MVALPFQISSNSAPLMLMISSVHAASLYQPTKAPVPVGVGSVIDPVSTLNSIEPGRAFAGSLPASQPSNPAVNEGKLGVLYPSFLFQAISSNASIESAKQLK